MRHTIRIGYADVSAPDFNRVIGFIFAERRRLADR